MKKILSVVPGSTRLRTILLFLLVVLAAFAMRTHNYNREVRAIASIIPAPGMKSQTFFGQFLPVTHLNFVPYSIECAMMYGYIQDIASGKGVLSSDPNLHGLEDIAPYRQMIMGLEYFVGYGYRLKNLFFKDPAPSPEQKRYQDNVYLAQWTALQLRLWIAFSSGFIFLLLKILHCKSSLAFFGGLLHAVAIAAIARSTGQDIIRGSFALPMLSAMLLLLYSCYLKGRLIHYILLGLTAFLAFSTWDLSLGIFSALTIWEICRYLASGKISRRRKNAWILMSCAVVCSSLLIPFNQTYQTIMSPLCVILLPLLMLCCCLGSGVTFRKRFFILLFSAGLLFLFWNFAVKTPHYVSHYSHFSQLTKAKLQFNNIKPRDPAKLTYDARMMWTPAMHSATWKILSAYFPALGSVIPLRSVFKFFNNLFTCVPLSLGSFYLLLLLGPFFQTAASVMKRNNPRNLFFYGFTFVFTVGFIYIVRYHEFLILFLCISLPLLLSDLGTALRIRRAVPGISPKEKLFLKFLKGGSVCLCLAMVLLEMSVSLFGRRNYSGEIALRETAQLIAWFRSEKIPGKCVITDFSLGPMLKCYAGCAIALQPQFGLERIRRPVEEFLKEMYHGSEESLAEFCTKLRADFLVYHKGYAGPAHIYSDRYIANARRLKDTSPANLMRYRKDRLIWFYPVEPPEEFRSVSGVYTVYRLIRKEDRLTAAQLCFKAQEYYRKGQRRLARRLIRSAFLLDPASELIRMSYFRICSEVPRLGLNGIRKAK